MIVNCPHCSCKYNIPDSKIGDSPKRFRCRKCKETFIIEPPEKNPEPEIVTPPVKKTVSDSHARRFARVLASDILVYNRELIEKAREEGNLTEVLEREIQKSWELWESRFPEESSKNPEIFSDALNQYLADGRDVFSSQSYS